MRFHRQLIAFTATAMVTLMSEPSIAQPDRIAALNSCNSKISLAAAHAVIKEPVSSDPLELIHASFSLFRSGELELAVFWFYAGQMRLRDHLTLDPAEGGIATAVMMAGQPITRFALQDTKSFALTIQKVLDWDKRILNPLRVHPQFVTSMPELTKIRAGLAQLRQKLLAEGDALQRAAKAQDGSSSRSFWASQIGCKD